MSSDWYLIHTKPQQERSALLNLERQGYRAYLPLHCQRRRRGRQIQSIVEPLFPRYLFIFLNTESDDWGPIRSTRGVANLVRFGGRPAKLPAELVVYLQAEETDRLESSSETVFEKGDLVEISEGVLASYQGVLQEKMGSKRAVILLQIADRFTTVQVPIRSLEKRL